MSTTTEALIDAVTREVVAVLAARNGADCSDPACRGDCAAHCADKVRGVVSNGAERISYSGDGAEVPRDLARFIDHTLLKPDATAEEIDRLCEEARRFGFAAVCVNPTWVRRCAQNLRGSNVRVASVVGFPLRRRHHRGEGDGGAPRDPRRRPRDRHGDQHRRVEERRP